MSVKIGLVSVGSSEPASGGGGGSGTVTSIATTSDLTGGPITTSGTIGLANTTVTAGAHGDASHVATFTADAKGRLTASGTTAIQITESQVTNLVTDLAGKQATGSYVTGLTGDVTASGPGNVAATLSSTGVSAGSVGSASNSGTFTVDAKGRLSAAASVAIQIAESQVTNLVSDLAGKQTTGNYLTALTGDITAAGPGSGVATLATVNSNVGTFGSASTSASVNANAKGLIIAATDISIQIDESQVTNLTTDLAGKQDVGNYITDLTGDATASGPGSAALTLSDSGVVADSYGNVAMTPYITVDSKGRITALTENSIQIDESQVNNLTSDLASKADDSSVVHLADTETITGDKTFSTAVTLPAAAPTNPTDAANKAYVDAIASGISPKAAVRLLADSNQTLSGLPTIDGVATQDGDRLLLIAQTTGTENGFQVAHSGAWTRPADFATGSQAEGAYALVEEGTANALSGWVCTTLAPSDAVDTDPLAFAQFNGAADIIAGDGLDKSVNTLFIKNAPFTPGAIIFADGSGNLTQDAANLSYDSGTGKMTMTGVLDPSSLLLTGADKKIGATDAGTIYISPAVDAARGIELRKANGANILSVDTSQSYVGVGTISPSFPLDIGSASPGSTSWGNVSLNVSNSGTEAGVSLNNTSADGRQYNIISTGTGSGIGVGKLSIGDATASQNRIVIDATGNVGIGTTSPSANLEVTGAIRIAGADTSTYLDFTDGENVGNSNTDEMRIRFNANTETPEISVNGSGYLQIPTMVAGAPNQSVLYMNGTAQQGDQFFLWDTGSHRLVLSPSNDINNGIEFSLEHAWLKSTIASGNFLVQAGPAQVGVDGTAGAISINGGPDSPQEHAPSQSSTVSLSATANFDSTQLAPPAFDITDPGDTSTVGLTGIIEIDAIGGTHSTSLWFRTEANGTWEWYHTVDGADVSGGSPGVQFLIGQGTITYDGGGTFVSQATIFSSAAWIDSAPTQTLTFDFSNSTQLASSSTVPITIDGNGPFQTGIGGGDVLIDGGLSTGSPTPVHGNVKIGTLHTTAIFVGAPFSDTSEIRAVDVPNRVLANASGSTSLNWQANTLTDTLTTGAVSAAWGARNLLATDGTSVAVDWSVPGALALGGIAGNINLTKEFTHSVAVADSTTIGAGGGGLLLQSGAGATGDGGTIGGNGGDVTANVGGAGADGGAGGGQVGNFVVQRGGSGYIFRVNGQFATIDLGGRSNVNGANYDLFGIAPPILSVGAGSSATNSAGTTPGLMIQNLDLTDNNFAVLAFDTQTSGNTLYSAARVEAQFTSHDGGNADLVFETASGSSLAEKMRLTSTGNLLLATGIVSASQFILSGGDNRVASTAGTLYLATGDNSPIEIRKSDYSSVLFYLDPNTGMVQIGDSALSGPMNLQAFSSQAIYGFSFGTVDASATNVALVGHATIHNASNVYNLGASNVVWDGCNSSAVIGTGNTIGESGQPASLNNSVIGNSTTIRNGSSDNIVGGNNIFVGVGVSSGVALGNGATIRNGATIGAISAGVGTVSDGGIHLGYSPDGFSNAPAGWFVVGGSLSGVATNTDVVFGNGHGMLSGSGFVPAAYTIRGVDAVAGDTNIVGADVTIAGGRGTGTGAGGSVFIAVAPAGSAGTTQNATTNVAQFTAAGASIAGTLGVGGTLIDMTGGATTGNVLTFNGTAFAPAAPVGTAVTSVSNSDSTITISPTTGDVIASLNLSNANTWLAAQSFSDGAGHVIAITPGATGTVSNSSGNMLLDTDPGTASQTTITIGHVAQAASTIIGTAIDIQAGYGNASNGGAVAIKGGNADGTDMNGGNVAIDAGAPTGVGNAFIVIGTANAKRILVGHSDSEMVVHGMHTIAGGSLLSTVASRTTMTADLFNTTDATADQVAFTFTPESDASYDFIARINATNDGTGPSGDVGDQAVFHIYARGKTITGAASLKPWKVDQDLDTQAANWSANISTDGTSFFVNVTGDTDMSVKWSVTLEAQHNSYL